MLTVPGIMLRGESRASTEILCPSGCGATVFRLRARESIVPSSWATGFASQRIKEGECPECESLYRISVGESST